MNNNKDEYRDFIDLDEADEWGEQYYGQWAKKYNGTDNPLAAYCGNQYITINAYLRGLDKTQKYSYLFNHSQQNVEREFNELTNCLKKMILSAPRVPENITVYRYTSDDFVYKMIENSKKRDWTYDKGFLSTSLSHHIAKDITHTKYLLKIYVRKNTIGVFAPSVAYGGELEMLFYPNCGLRINEKFISKPLFLRKKIHNKLVYECELIYPDVTNDVDLNLEEA